MTSKFFVSLVGVMMVELLVTMARPALSEEGNIERTSFIMGDVLLVWQSGRGAAVTYRGVPLFAPNPAELVAHRAWQDVYYRNGDSKPKATLAEGADSKTLTISDRTEHFAFEKRIIVRGDSSVRLEYEYQLLDPEKADIQVLFEFGRQWIHESKYLIISDGDKKEGELKCPNAGRTDPWSNATEQVFTTNYGTLTLKAGRGLNLYCTPNGGALWWAHGLTKGEKYTQSIEARIEPGPAAETGLVLSGLKWPERVRNGLVQFTLQLAKAPDGPDTVEAHVELATGSATAVGPLTEAKLSNTPTEVKCEVKIDQKGYLPFAVVIKNAETGKALLRIAPVHVELSPLLRVLPRLSLYTSENQAEIVMDVADDVKLDGLTLELTGDAIAKTQQTVTAHRTLMPIDIAGLAEGLHAVTCRVLRGEELLADATTQLRKASPKPNEVKIDNISRGLIVDGLPFIPFGYYTYYPLAEGVMDGEVVRGFNLFSPYHGGPHVGDDLKPIREYMDRCAAIGMKVNYHLMWSNKTKMSDEEWAALRTEIEAFRDHPALLSWYTADEPTADRVPHLEKVNQLLKELDPYHPVTVVFYRGAEHARKFAGVMDIVMGDPYPIPNRPATFVNEMADSLNDAFDFAKPLWIVPQCFGGNEGWRREPTAGEQRVMTYLALVHGARGIQYFIRSPRISFPKSPIMWAECGALALETAELTPALLSDEPQPKVASSAPEVHVSAYRDRGIVTVLAVNTQNRPRIVRFELPEIDYTGEASVLFEDRKASVKGGAIEEPIDAFGTRAYAIPVGPLPKEDLTIKPGNLTYNPSYEYIPSVGTPAGCYANIPAGATFRVDSRVARHGRHSLLMSAPTDDKAPSISPFPVSLKGGQEYRVSIWAKARSNGVLLNLSLGDLGKGQFTLTTEWKEYGFNVKPKTNIGRIGAGIALGSAGVAWLDLFQIFPVEADKEG